MDRFKELIEKWERRSWNEEEKHHQRISQAIDDCISDLRETLLLIEADKVLETE